MLDQNALGCVVLFQASSKEVIRSPKSSRRPLQRQVAFSVSSARFIASLSCNALHDFSPACKISLYAVSVKLPFEEELG